MCSLLDLNRQGGENTNANKYLEMTERIDAIPRAEYPALVWALKRGEWDDRLGSKPDNWTDMDQSERINAASAQIDYLQSKVSRKEADRYFLTHYLQYTEQQVEDAWDSAIMEGVERLTNLALHDRKNPLENAEVMLGQQAGSKRKKRIQKCKEYMKSAIRFSFLFSTGVLCDDYPFMFFFGGLFLLHLLLDC